MNYTPEICIYHSPCQDGFTAAWAIWKRWPGCEFVPAFYGAPPPEVSGKHVLIVDFSYKRDALWQLGQHAASVTILDHHKSAAVDLAPFAVETLRFPPEMRWYGQSTARIQALVDMERSGARMAWDFAFPDAEPPALVRHVEDRDLWRFALHGTREVCACLFSLEYDFRTWSEYAAGLDDPTEWAVIAREGEAIERKHHKDVRELLKVCAREMTIGGHRVKVASIPYTMSSDAAGALAEGMPFGACYYDLADGGRAFSLRSREGGIDVSEIAVRYGGGGHAKAAGFTAPRGWEGDSGEGQPGALMTGHQLARHLLSLPDHDVLCDGPEGDLYVVDGISRQTTCNEDEAVIRIGLAEPVEVV